MPSCDINAMAAFLDGGLSGAELSAFEEHVDTCADCRASLGAFGRAAVSTSLAELNPPGAVPIRIGDRIGRYVILDWLGEGGMGVVYAAHDPELDRRIALKVLRPDVLRPRSSDAARLLGEARAMARIGHPNVVTVFDAGTHGDQIFIAMERVDGPNLREWLRGRSRPWREIVSVFVAAGHGLAAAHAAGLVHRDFKPDNVLMGHDGRVRVTDFGLARAKVAHDEARDGAEAMTTIGGHGTPGYMAPEHADPERIDGRTDQFSFCVALYEALAGVRPFSWDDSPRSDRAPEPLRRVSRSVSDAVLRGLRVAKEERFASMDALIAALSPPLSRARTLTVAAAAVIAAGIGSAFAVQHTMRPPICPSAESKLAGAWDEPLRARVHAAFLATNKPYAEESWQRTERTLTSYAAAWSKMNLEVCEAAHVRREESAQLMDLRMDCLAAELRAMKAFTATLVVADGATVEAAVKSAGALRGVEACADGRALLAKVAPPADPALRAKMATVEEQVARTDALEKAGKYPQAAALAEPATREATSLGYPPLLAEALARQATVQWRGGDDSAAVASFYASAKAAELGRDDYTKAYALTSLVYVIGERQGKYADAERIAQLAEAAIERAGNASDLRARLLEFRAFIDLRTGAYEKARALQQEAVSLWEKTRGPDSFELGVALGNLGMSDQRLGDLPGALVRREKALAILKQAVGERHPIAAGALNNVTVSLVDLRRLDEAWPLAEKAWAIRVEALGPDAVEVGNAEQLLAIIAFEQGRYAEALPHALRALAIVERRRGVEAPFFAVQCNVVGRIDNRLGRLDEALSMHQRALAIWERLTAESAEFADTLQFLGEDWLASKRPGDAIAPLERALAMRSAPHRRQDELAETRFALARALVGARRDPTRARTLAEDALDYYANAAGREREREEVQIFLRTMR